jgi:hypothetical protein
MLNRLNLAHISVMFLLLFSGYMISLISNASIGDGTEILLLQYIGLIGIPLGIAGIGLSYWANGRKERVLAVLLFSLSLLVIFQIPTIIGYKLYDQKRDAEHAAADKYQLPSEEEILNDAISDLKERYGEQPTP